MENQLINQSNVATPSTINAEKIRSLKSIIMPPRATEADLELFIEYCRRTNLDPFARQIYAIDMQGKLSIQTSIDGFRVIAQRTGEYRGQEVFWCDDTGVWKDVWLSNKPPVAAKVLIYRDKLDKPVAGIALYNEYARDTYIWKKMPSTMLAKCAESLAFRKAFPNELSGLYTQEEMPQGNNEVNIKEAVENPIDNTVYNIETNTYEIDYTIIPKGPNQGQKWNILSLDIIKKTIEYYLGKNDSDSQKYIDAIIQNCFEPINNNACAGDLIYCYDTKQICYIQEDIYEKESEYIVHYFQINNEKCLAKSYYYSECFVFKREDRENDLRKKYTKRKEAEGILGVDKEKQDFPNITATEDEDPFSSANDEDWDKDWDTISNELDSTKSTLDDLVDDNTSLFNNGEKND